MKPSDNIGNAKSDKIEGAVLLDSNFAEVPEKVEKEEIKEKVLATIELPERQVNPPL